MPDVINKFTYIQIGKSPPKESRYKADKIGSDALFGYFDYTTKEDKKEKHDELVIAESGRGLFGYTSRPSATNSTYSSMGLLDTPQKENAFKLEASKGFNNEGDIAWLTYLSLKDYETSFDFRLFNSEDYGAIFEKIVPKFFKKVGFDPENMHWWTNHHMDTDNPHVHFTFLEKENKNHLHGKIPAKHLNVLKGMFYDEAFARKRYLDEVGMSAVDAFKLKDIQKKEILSSLSAQLTNSKNTEFQEELKQLYLQLPEDGRLQYNATHMIPYRDQLDDIVDRFFDLPGIHEKYLEFEKIVKSFDTVKSKNLHDTYTALFDQEDKKLRIQLANKILQNFKGSMSDFYEQDERVYINSQPISNANIDDSELAYLEQQMVNYEESPIDDLDGIDVSEDLKAMNEEDAAKESPFDEVVEMDYLSYVQEHSQKQPIDTQEYKEFFISEKLVKYIDKNYALIKLPGKNAHVHLATDRLFQKPKQKYFVGRLYEDDAHEFADASGNGIDFSYIQDKVKYETAFCNYQNINHFFAEKPKIYKKESDESGQSEVRKPKAKNSKKVVLLDIKHIEEIPIYNTKTMFNEPIQHTQENSKFIFLGAKRVTEIDLDNQMVGVRIPGPGNWEKIINIPMDRFQQFGSSSLIVEIFEGDTYEVMQDKNGRDFKRLDGGATFLGNDEKQHELIDFKDINKVFWDYEVLFAKWEKAHEERMENLAYMREFRREKYLESLDYENQKSKLKTSGLRYIHDAEHELEKAQSEFYGRYDYVQ